MKIHEFQAKNILAKYGVPVPLGEVVESAADAAQVATKLGGGVSVVKAQIHAGGRGKGGGVKVVKSADEARQMAEKILGMTLVTHQTGPRGQRVGSTNRPCSRSNHSTRIPSTPEADSRSRKPPGTVPRSSPMMTARWRCDSSAISRSRSWSGYWR